MCEIKNNAGLKAWLHRFFLILGGVVVAVIVVELVVRAGVWGLCLAQDIENYRTIRAGGKYRVLCIGESTTQRAYPAFLEKALNSSGGEARFVVIDKGLAASNTAMIMADLEKNLDRYRPDIVVAMMGINDGRVKGMNNEDHPSVAALFLKNSKAYSLLWLLGNNLFEKRRIVKSDLQRDEENKEHGVLSCAPADAGGWIAQGWQAFHSGKIFDAEKYFRRAVFCNPGSDGAWYGLGMSLFRQNKTMGAEESFRESVALNPRNAEAMIAQGELYKFRYNSAETPDVYWIDRSILEFQKAVAAASGDRVLLLRALNALGWCYVDRGMRGKGVELFELAFRLDPANGENPQSLSMLVYDCLVRKDFRKATELIALARQEYPDRAHVERLASMLSGRMGTPPPLAAHGQGFTDAPQDQTRQNYGRLKKILDARRIRLVCVQYPMRKLKSLKEIFPPYSGVVFVDNEKVFQDAVRQSGYDKYFIDMFGGDFGHCTNEGNALLARNIADAILKEIFGK